MRTFVEDAGMMCVQQEIVPWGPPDIQMYRRSYWPWMIDCMSMIINKPGNQCHVVRNPRFMEEAEAIKRISSLRAAGIAGRRWKQTSSIQSTDPRESSPHNVHDRSPVGKCVAGMTDEAARRAVGACLFRCVSCFGGG